MRIPKRCEPSQFLLRWLMVKTLEKAIAEVSRLPDSDQEEIGRQILSHVEKLKWLRTEIDKGIKSLDRGEGQELDMDELLRDLNQRHGKE